MSNETEPVFEMTFAALGRWRRPPRARGDSSARAAKYPRGVYPGSDTNSKRRCRSSPDGRRVIDDRRGDSSEGGPSKSTFDSRRRRV